MDHSEVKHLPKVDYAPAELDGPSKLLLKAATLLEERGWCQGAYANAAGGFCLMGAITYAETGIVGSRRDDGDAATHRLLSAIKSSWGNWNDRPGRTKDEVVAKLRAVALGIV